MDKRCAQCEMTKSEEQFYRSKKSRDGRDTYCKDCRDGRVLARRERLHQPRPAPPTEKACSKCGIVKSLKEFYVRKDRPGGQSACKDCRNEYHRQYIARPEVAAKLLEQERNRAEGQWKRPPRREPKAPGWEVCTACNEDKPVEEFHKHKLGRNGRDSVCRDCKAALHKERRRDPEYREKEHRWSIARRFGIEPQQYDQMLAAQDGLCAICGKIRGNDRRLHVDHDHLTGAIRGLLCYNCNTGLGVFQDDPALLSAAIDYLARYNRQ